MKNRTQVTANNRKRIVLSTDDTLTLAFPGMMETSPAILRAVVSEKSLKRIAAEAKDSNEQSKAERALNLRLQLSNHGCGKRSAQIFDGSKLVLDWNF